jgi:hypothetical protein
MRSHLNQWLGAVESDCHPSYKGKHKYEDHGSGQPRHKVRPYLKNDEYIKGWWSGSSGREPA